MSVPLESTERFFRPADVESLRRDYRSIRLRSFLRVLRNAFILAALVAAVITLTPSSRSSCSMAPAVGQCGDGNRSESASGCSRLSLRPISSAA